MLRIGTRVTNDVMVLTLKGNIMSDTESDKLSDQISGLKEDGHNKIVLDLGDIYLINSEGVGTLLAGLKSLQAINGNLKLANLSDRAMNVLVLISHLSGVFDIHDTVDQAVDGFAETAATA